MINDLLNQLKAQFKALGVPEDQVLVSASQRPDLADYQCNTALSAQKTLKQNPMDVAGQIINKIKSNDFDLSVVKPGFINIKLTPKALVKIPKVQKTNNPLKVLIDFSSPNVAKGMHVGHLRSTLIGASLVKIYKFLGHPVVSDNHLGDWGTPLGIVIAKILKEKDYQYSLDLIEKLYIEGSIEYKSNEDFKNEVQKITDKLQQNDEQLKKIWANIILCTIDSLKSDYQSLGISFDEYLGESFYEKLIPKMIEDFQDKNLIEKSEGATVIKLKDDKNPLLIEKSNGGYLYQTTDLACLKYRHQEGFEKVLYVVDKRQKLHFEQVFEAASEVGYLSGLNPVHVTFGTVNGEDGKPYKTRNGNVLKLTELIKEAKIIAKEKLETLQTDYTEDEKNEISNIVAIGGLKFAELKHNRNSDYVFNLEKFMALEGYTGPYVMYAGVRIKSILNKISSTGEFSLDHEFSSEEKALLFSLHKLSSIVEKSAAHQEPNHLCELAYEIAKNFNSFYQKHPIVSEESEVLKSHYVWIIKETLNTLTTTLNLLGIDIPEKM